MMEFAAFNAARATPEINDDLEPITDRYELYSVNDETKPILWDFETRSGSDYKLTAFCFGQDLQSTTFTLEHTPPNNNGITIGFDITVPTNLKGKDFYNAINPILCSISQLLQVNLKLVNDDIGSTCKKVRPYREDSADDLVKTGEPADDNPPAGDDTPGTNETNSTVTNTTVPPVTEEPPPTTRLLEDPPAPNVTNTIDPAATTVTTIFI